MAISQETIEHVAKLARLEISDQEKNKFTQELGEILNYVDELSSANTGSITPISQISELSNIARTDEITNENNRDKMLANAPEQKDGFIRVKKVFE